MRRFREDFCGTALLSCEVVARHRENHALGVDLDGPTLDWAREHNLSRLTEHQRRRVQLVQADVLDVRQPRADLIAALNFSYCVFKTRPELLAYARNAHRSLVDGGMFLVDAWGGSETQVLQAEERQVDGDNGSAFTYIWDQTEFDPVSYSTTCRIHFEFRDGSRIRNAFVYDWRLWTMPELREVFEEAGFRDVHVLWEGTDRDTMEGNGVFRRVQRGDPDPSWIAYVVGLT
jgi:SAM-dependent methyltransferase